MSPTPFLTVGGLAVALLVPGAGAATAVHEFDASSPSNVLSGQTLEQWVDIGPGHNYSDGQFNININRASGIQLTPNFTPAGTNFTASFQSGGSSSTGAKPEGQPRSASIGNGLTDGSIEIWFRADLDDTERLSHQVLFESGAGTNGFTIALNTNGIFDAELRVLKAWNNSKIVDLVVPLPDFEADGFIQVVATFDGDAAVDNNDSVRLYARDVAGHSAFGESLNKEFSTLAGSDDSCAFNAANNNSFGRFGNSGGNSGNTVNLSAFKGEIALIRVYNTALTLAEIDAAYAPIADLGDDDNDGMTNFWEDLNGFDKDDPSDAFLDADADGLDNLGEFQEGSDPRDDDSDNDGLKDGQEISIGSDPNSPDSDGDGIPDGDEVVADPFVTSPILADTDGDQIDDPVELMIGSDPTDIHSIGTSVLITEFLASNGTGLEDEDGDTSDWIEILNPTTAAVDLSGMALTDDASTRQKWLFPAGTVLPAGEFLVVFASGKDRAIAGQQLHTNFNLSSGGEYLGLIAADGITAVTEFSPGYPGQESDVSFGFNGLFLPVPTPGAVNGTGVTGFVADTAFSIDRGFYDAPIQVTITTATPGANIIYTTDSSTPSLTNGTQSNASSVTVPIAQTTVLRAAAYKAGLAPTNVDTHSYLFLDDIVAQSDDPADYEYPNWNNLDQSRTADYGMDPAIAGGLHTIAEVKASLASLPTISMATDAASLFDRETGNYANSKKGGQAWEREVSMEFFGFDHGVTAQSNCGLRLAGNASRSPNRHKHNMRVAFRREYGDGTLEFPLFPGETVTTFNSIQLRAGNGDSWVNPGVRDRATYLRDQWHRDMQIEMGQHSQSQIFAHLYINGMYWGVFHIFERIEDDFMVEHFGGEEGDWDVRDHVNAFDGNDASWNAAVAIADDPATMADPQNYADLQAYIDYVHLIDYLLIHFYSNSDDWDQNNLRSGRNRSFPDTYEFFAWDQERTLLNTLSAGNVNGATAIDKDTNTNSKKGMTHLHQRLRANPEYRLLFADRVHKHCFNGGALTPTRTAEIWDARAAEARPSIIAESARWGDLHGTAKTLADWENRVALEKTGWFNLRTPILLNHLRNRNLYPQTAAPEYNVDGTPQHGGQAARNAALNITATSGTIYYTLDGSDPREPVTGNPSGLLFSAPIPLDGSVVVKARALDGGEWSALSEAEFLVGTPPQAGDLVVSELMYHPAGDGLAEFIEIMNISAASLDLSGVRFDRGISFQFPIGTTLDAGARILVVRDQTAFESVHGVGLPVAGEFADGSVLSDGGETIALAGNNGLQLLNFTYNDRGAWPRGADGQGFSLVLIRPGEAPDHGDPASWRSSREPGGTPDGSDSLSFADWASGHGVIDPLSDSDGDDLPAVLEFLLGSDPGSGAPAPILGASLDPDGSELYPTLQFQRAPGTDEMELRIAMSSDLITWTTVPLSAQIVRNERAGDLELITVRSPTPTSSQSRQFLRLELAAPAP